VPTIKVSNTARQIN